MGSFYLRDLFTSQQVADYSAGPVSANTARYDMTAMHIIKKDGKLIFDMEIPVFHFVRHVYEVAGVVSETPRMEFKVAISNKEKIRSIIQPGYDLAFAEWPYNRAVFKTAKFKSPCKDDRIIDYRKSPEQEEMGSTAFFDSLDEELNFDYCEGGNYYTAAFRMVSSLSDSGKFYNFDMNLMHVIGVCSDFISFRDELLEHCQTQDWYENTDSLLMTQFVSQALAGPHENSKGWQGKPVLDLVKEIYTKYMDEQNSQTNQ